MGDVEKVWREWQEQQEQAVQNVRTIGCVAGAILLMIPLGIFVLVGLAVLAVRLGWRP